MLLKSYIRSVLLKEASPKLSRPGLGKDDTDEVREMMREKYGMDMPSNWVDNFDSERGYIMDPQNLVHEMIILTAVNDCKEYCKNMNGVGSLRDVKERPRMENEETVGMPFLLPDVSSGLSEYSELLRDEGFHRVSIFVGGYTEDAQIGLVKSKGEVVDKGWRDRLYDVHLYVRAQGGQVKCAFPKIKINPKFRRPKGYVGS